MVENRILRSLPAAEWERLRSHSTTVSLTTRQIIYERQQTIDHILFVESGVISQVTDTDDIEVGLVGFEGIVGGIALLQEVNAVLRTIVQADGKAWVIEATTARTLLNECPVFRALCYQYLHVVMGNTAQLVGCNLRHGLNERLSRWLLMFRDRLQGDCLPITHEFIAGMLGVRRPGITLALRSMQGRGLIRQSRGRLRILDSVQLEAEACSCYQTMKRLYTDCMFRTQIGNQRERREYQRCGD